MGDRYDVVILGGGPAGLATALALRAQGDFSVLVVDAGAQCRERAGESAPPDLTAPLRRLRLEETFLAAGHASSPGSAVIWGREQIGYNDDLLNPMGPSWRLHRSRFDDMLALAAIERGIEVRWNTRYTGANSADGFSLNFSPPPGEDPAEVRTRWVVDATGPGSRFAWDLGVKSRIDDRLFALAAYSDIQGGQATHQVLIEATAHGWWYAARLPDSRLVCMFVTAAPALRQIKFEGPAGWSAWVGKTRLIGPALSGLQLSGPKFQTFPIYSSLLERPAGTHWLAVGDAASCYDPVASQGLYKALSDGVAAGRALAGALHTNASCLEDSYAAGITERYEKVYHQRCRLYEQEQRWPNSSFWSGRRKAGGTGLPARAQIA